MSRRIQRTPAQRGASSRLPSSIEPLVVPLDDTGLTCLAALIHAFDTLRSRLPEEEWLGAPANLIVHLVPGGDELAEHVWAVGSLLLRRASGSDAAVVAATVAADELVAAAARLGTIALEEGDDTPSPNDLPAELRGSAVRDVTVLLHEIGLDERDALVILAGDEERPFLLWSPVSRAQATVALLTPLFVFTGFHLIRDPMLMLESQASAWQFATWSVDGGIAGSGDMAATTRAAEWSFIARRTVSLDAPIVTAFCDEPFIAHLPPRQRALYRALPRSFASLFAVRELTGDTTILEDLLSLKRYTVREHSEDIDYRPGFLAVGRLIPIDGAHIRSPGMVFFEYGHSGAGASLAEGLATADRTGMPRELAIEAIISQLLAGRKVPRSVPPARSRKEANELLYAFSSEMREAGLAEEVPAERAPASLRAFANSPQRQVLGFEVDETLSAWVGALSVMAGIVRGGATGPSGYTTASKKTKKRMRGKKK